MKNLTNNSKKKNFSIKDIYLDRQEHLRRRILQDSDEKAKTTKKVETKKAVSLEEKLLLSEN